MKVIILCGGAGTRLKEETEFKPKPMVHIGGKPILWHIMKIYSYYGFKDFILALGYKAEYIKEFFLNQKAFLNDFTLETCSYNISYHLKKREELDDFNITFVDTGIDTNVGERVLLCQKYIPQDDKYFMLTYGDGIADININKLVEYHIKKQKIGTITGVHPHSKYGLININKQGLVEHFIEKPILEDWVNGGFMIFDKRVFDYIKPGEMEHPALQRLTEKKQLTLFKHEGFWFSVDTYKELEELNKIYDSGKIPWKIW